MDGQIPSRSDISVIGIVPCTLYLQISDITTSSLPREPQVIIPAIWFEARVILTLPPVTQNRKTGRNLPVGSYALWGEFPVNSLFPQV